MCLCASHHTHGHPCRAFECSLTLCSSPCSFPRASPIPCSSLTTSTWTLLPPCGRRQGNYPLALRQMRSLAPWPNSPPLTGHEPKLPDDFHFSETTEIIFRDESSDAVPSYFFDAELDDETIGRAFSAPLFIQEREDPADRRQAYHSYEESLLPAKSFSVCHSRTGRSLHELSSPSSRSREKPSRDSENERIRFLFERQQDQILTDFRAEIHKHEFQADSDRRSIQELSGIPTQWNTHQRM